MPVLEDICNRKGVGYNIWQRLGWKRGWEEQERLVEKLKMMIKREPRRLDKTKRDGMLREPLWEKAKAIKVDNRNRQRRKDCAHRCGKKMSPKALNQHWESAHKQHQHPALQILKFKLPTDFQGKIRREIEKGKRNMAVGADGIDVQMIWAAPAVCATLLVAWWEAVGRLGILSEAYVERILYILYKKGAKDDPCNYHPVCLLLHARK